jgi:hypothetical protein
MPAMTDLSIDRLNLQITGASGQEHRVHAIVQRATVLLGERLVQLAPELPTAGATIPEIAAEPVALDLSRTDDESCACQIADSVLHAVRFQIGG